MTPGEVLRQLLDEATRLLPFITDDGITIDFSALVYDAEPW